MKKMYVFFMLIVFLSITVLSENYTFIFKDVQLFYTVSNETSFLVPEGFDVLWISGVDSWELKKVYQHFPFKITSLEDYTQKSIEAIDEDIYKIVGTNEILFFNPQLNRWCVTDEKNKDKIQPPTQILLKNPKNAVIALKGEGSWEIIYEMKNDGTFSKNVQINGVPVGQTNLYLVNEYLNLSPRDYLESTKLLSNTRMASEDDFEIVAQEAILSQTYTMNLGRVNFQNSLMNVRISQNDILSYEDRNVINFSLYTNITNYTKTEIIRHVENTKYNGLGIELPSGKVWIHEEFDSESFPIKLAYINDTPVGDTFKINLGESWDVQYKIEKLSDVEVKSANSRIVNLLISVKNFSKDKQIVNLSMSTPNIEIDEMQIEGNYQNLKNNSEKGKIDIVFDIIDEVRIRMTIKTILRE
ncbi:hypothetical protein X928_10150 [Petrotoga miotherma DSM 10691]|uniref:DUF4139 domain-containing protein n=1 Tax=Petrotoga miotherma DSM 10691 TaxID=1434326 RepID=A0A2K1P3R2_9BACT|nr:hypothetical protein [Petrotoga miotherma]PNR97367.1 hypothetical protein X928_10150 [Petrotoga miotherma DSM 10691]